MIDYKRSPSLFMSSGLFFATFVVMVSLLGFDSIISAEAKSFDRHDLGATPNLPFGDINVVVLTDIHSWLGSHRHQEPHYDADLGNVLSFWERLKEYCDSSDHGPCRNLFLVNNGDFVDGTGLSRAIDGENNPAYLIPLLEKMPYDAVNVGNHELYSKKNIEYMTKPGGYVDWWGDRYLTSNIHKVDNLSKEEATLMTGISKTEPKDPLGSRYKILHGDDSKLLTFGFLYNMGNAAKDAGIEIEKVQTTVKQQWFSDALTEEEYDAILVLAHMDLVDPLVDVLRKAIRGIIGENTPIVFLTGHTHHRGYKQLEDLTVTFEAGRYLDTVGFISFPKKDSVRSGNNSSLFRHNYLDANRKLLFEDTLGFSSADEGETANGKEFSEFIHTTRKKLGLERVVGCAPQSYYAEHPVDAPDSLWGFFRDEVIPKIFSAQVVTAEEEDDLPTAMLLPSESFRYNLLNTEDLVVDDIYAVAPFNDTLVHMGTFSSDVILEANKTLNKHSWKLPNFILIGTFDDASDNPLVAVTKKYHLYSYEFQAGDVEKAIAKIAPSEKVEIKKTEWTSSLIWLSFVEQYWPCDSTSGKLPGWFPKYQNLVSYRINENDELVDTKLPMSATSFLTFLAAILLVVSMSVTLFWIVLRRYFAYQPVVEVHEEDVAFGEEEGFYKLDGFEKSAMVY